MRHTRHRDVRPKSSSEAGPRSSYWIFGPLPDLTCVLLTPLVILAVFAAARRGGWAGGLVAFALALAMAHYLPGILRAYGDRALFKRFRIRLTLAPLVLVASTTGMAYLNLNFVFLLLGLWGAWHWMMQIYGFARIYDARSGRTPARLDQAVCLAWFGTAVFVLNDALPAYATRFYQSGGTLLPAWPFEAFTQAWFVLTLILIVIYGLYLLWGGMDRRWPNPLKLVFLILSFGYLTHTASLLDEPIVAWAMFESWHDVQYLALVWLFNLNRARRSPEAGRFIQALFRPRLGLALAYFGICLAFGWLTHAWRLFDDPVWMRVVAAIVPAAAFLHYYLDGFIWKIREEDTRRALDLGLTRPAVPERGRPSSPPPLPPPPAFRLPGWAQHAALWLLLLGPGALLYSMESTGGAARPPVDLHRNVVETFPDYAVGHYELGRALQQVGRWDEARVRFERSLALEPDLQAARASLGVLLADVGDLGAASAHLRRALELGPGTAEVHNNLGIVLDDLGDAAAARSHLEAAVAIDPEYALAHNNLGVVLGGLGDIDGARRHHQRAVEIDPEFVDGHFRLGLVLARTGDAPGAVEHLGQAIRIDPGHIRAHDNLGIVLASQGRLQEAIGRFEEALRIDPGDARARENLALALEEQAGAGERGP